MTKRMSIEWKETTLGDITNWMSGGTPNKGTSKFWNGNIPWISANSMDGSRYSTSDLMITQDGLENGSRLAPQGSILLLVRGGALHNKIPVGVAMRDVAFNQDVKAITGKQGIDPWFLFAWFCAKKQFLLNNVVELTGIGAGKLDTDRLKSLHVLLPPLNEQKAIAHIIKALDDKIELNRKMNATLENMARVLFKSWFVDFEPIHTKMKGKQSFGLDTATAALFPSKFIQSSLGDIPEGWAWATLRDVAQNPRLVVQPEQIQSDTPYIGLEHMPRRSIALDAWGRADDVSSHKSSFVKGDFLFGKLRPYFHKVGIAVVDGICSTDIAIVRPTKKEFYAFVISVISSDEFVQYTDQLSNGAKMPRINWSDMARYSIALPSTPVASAFNDKIKGGLERIILNVQENRKLSAIRDYLLPKLISGDIRVPDAKKFVEAA